MVATEIPDEVEPVISARRGLWLLGAIVLLGLVARFWNLDWDAGAYALHPDEWALNQVVRRLGPDLNPHFFFYGSFPIYLYRATAEVLTALTGLDWLDATRISLIGRFYSALESALIMPVVFLIGRRFWGVAAGLVASVGVAGAPLLIQAAHFGAVDTLVTLAGITLLWLSLKIGDGASMGTYLVTGLVLGLAAATKLTALSFLLMPAIACFFGSGRDTGERTLKAKLFPLVMLLAIAGATTLLASPYYVLAWNELWSAIQEQSHELNGGYVLTYTWQFIGSTPYLFELRNLIVWSLGIPLGVAALAGWIWSIVQVIMRRAAALPMLLLVIWPTLYFLYIGTWEARFVRHTLPLIPFLCLFAAGGLYALVRWCREQGSVLRIASRVLPGIVIAGGALWGLAFVSVYTSTDTRLAATAWMHTNIPSGTHLVVEDKDTLLPLMDASHPPDLYKYGVVQPTAPDSPSKMESIANTLSQGEILVLSSRRWSGVIPRLANFPLTARYYSLLVDGKLGYTSLVGFSSPPRLGPLLFNDDDAEETFQVFDHPTVRLYSNTGHFTAAEIERLLQP